MSQKKKKKKPASSAKPAPKATTSNSISQDKLAWILVGIAILFVMFIRFRILDVPLERDEGEYAYAAQQLLHGIPPFESIYHVKLPGIYAAYAVIEVLFGQTHTGIHLGMLLMNVITALLVFFIGKRIFDPLTAALGTVFFCILTLSQKLEGFSANAEHFVLLPAMLGLLFLLRGFDTYHKESLSSGWNRVVSHPAINFFLSGLCLGISYTMKQHGIFFIAFAGVFFLFSWFRQKPLQLSRLLLWGGVLVFGTVLPLGLICLIYFNLGLFDEFWWWTWYYPREYATLISWEDGMNVYFKSAFYPDGEKQGIWDVFKVLLIMIAAGLVAVWRIKEWRKIVFTVGLFLFTAIAVTVGLSFYPHYFLLAAPAWAYLAAVTATTLGDLTTRLKIPIPRAGVAISLAVIVLLPSMSAEKKYYFQMTGNEVSRSKYGANPFPESLVIADYLRKNTAPDDEIAVFGSEPQIPFYAQRKNSTGFLYTYEMIADHPFVDSFQLQMINEVKTAMPKYVLFVGIKPSWIARRVNNLKTFIFTEAIAFINQNYEQIGIVDIGNELLADYCWEDLSTVQHECAPPMGEGNLSFLEKVWIGIYRRKQ